MNSAVMLRLRNETAEAHQRLEDGVGIEGKLQDPSSYKGLLEGFYGFYEPFEKKLEGVEGWGFDIRERSKLAWLREDLKSMGLTDDDLAVLPRCEDLPSVEDLAAAYGCAYVVEGSTLGGRTISAMLEKSRIPAGSRRFFRSYEGEVGAKWKEFCAALDGFASEDNADRIIEGASATFSHLYRWILR